MRPGLLMRLVSMLSMSVAQAQMWESTRLFSRYNMITVLLSRRLTSQNPHLTLLTSLIKMTNLPRTTKRIWSLWKRILRPQTLWTSNSNWEKGWSVVTKPKLSLTDTWNKTSKILRRNSKKLKLETLNTIIPSSMNRLISSLFWENKSYRSRVTGELWNLTRNKV